MRCGVILFPLGLRLLVQFHGGMHLEFVKIYPGFFKGSLVDTPPFARLLFLAMLSEADEMGVALGTVRYWASLVGITESEVLQGMEILTSPDPHSTSPDLEGRRIEPWGAGSNRWRIVNYAKYYEKSRNEDRKEYKRDWDRKNAETRNWRSDPNLKRKRPTQSDTSDRKPSQTKPKKTKEKEPPLPPTGDAEIPSALEDSWKEWLAYRKERKLPPFKPITIKKQIAFLSAQPDPAACINQSILNGWQGLFELKGSPNQSARPDEIEAMKARLRAEGYQ